MFRRALGLLLGLMLVVLPAFSSAENAFIMAGFDGKDSTRTWEGNGFFTRMEARTGLSFTFQQYNDAAAWQAAKDAMFAQGGELPDVLFKAALTTDELIRYTESGQLIDLLPLLEENAPNLWALLQENPDWLKAITLPNGKVGALPALQELAPQNAMWINKAWLDKLGLQEPTDMESLTKVLRAFRDRDPNGNNKKDEVPMLFLGSWELKFFSHAWGVVANDYNIYLADGQVHYWPQEDSFFELARTMRDLYAEELLDPNGFATSDAIRCVTDSDADITYGAFFAPTPLTLLPYTNGTENYVVMGPFEYEGKAVYRDLIGQVTRGTFAITSACEDPAALLRWVDILYTEEGAIEAMAGEEGVNYAYREEDGRWDWVGGAETLGLTGLAELTVYESGDMPWLFPLAFNDKYVEANVGRMNAELSSLQAQTVKPFPTYTLTEEENAYVGSLQLELGRYVDEMLARMVIGEIKINDETKAEFLSGLEERGVADMIAFWQEIAQR